MMLTELYKCQTCVSAALINVLEKNSTYVYKITCTCLIFVKQYFPFKVKALNKTLQKTNRKAQHHTYIHI